MDRVERHDLVNAVGLAIVLLAMAFALVFGARALFQTVNGGLTTSEKPEETAEGTDGADGTDSSAVTTPTDSTEPEDETTTTTAPQIHLPNEVLVRVGNGARRGGVAGAGTSIVEQAGYPTLSPKNAPSTESSVIYYVDGYAADAAQIARLLSVAETAIAPMPADTGIPQDDALIVVILGADTTVG